MAPLRKALRLGPADCVLLCHAVALHAAIAVLIRLAPFGWTLRHLDVLYARGGRRRPASRPDVEAKAVWAVRAVAAHVPAGSTCLTTALTAHYLLRGAGCESTIRFGVAPGPSGGAPLAAHAWLERRDESPSAVRVVIGGEDRARYRALEPAGAWLP